jgi:hypothetical protein
MIRVLVFVEFVREADYFVNLCERSLDRSSVIVVTPNSLQKLVGRSRQLLLVVSRSYSDEEKLAFRAFSHDNVIIYGSGTGP